MSMERFSDTAQQWITRFDRGAHHAIAAWRAGGERLGEAARGRWDSAFAQSSPKLSAQTRRDATRAREAFAGCYAAGLELSAGGSEAAVDTLVRAARATVERADGWRPGRA